MNIRHVNLKGMTDFIKETFGGNFSNRKTEVQSKPIEIKPIDVGTVPEDYRQRLNEQLKLEMERYKLNNQERMFQQQLQSNINDIEKLRKQYNFPVGKDMATPAPHTVYIKPSTYENKETGTFLLDGDKLQVDSFQDLEDFIGNVKGICVTVTVGPKTLIYKYNDLIEAWQLRDLEDEAPSKPKKKDTAKNSRAKLKAFEKTLIKK